MLQQRAKEDVLQKEVRVKILKDSIKLLAAKVPSGGQELTSELNVVLENYQLLCNRIRGKCHTLEVRDLFSDAFLRFKLCTVLAVSISWKKTLHFSFHILYHKSSSLMIKIMIGNNNSYNILFDDNLGNRLIKMKQREKKIGYKTLTAVGGRFLEKFLLSFRH